MLVEREPFDLLVELLEFVAEPVRKAVVDLADLLAHVMAAGSRTAAACLMRNDKCHAFVEGAGKQGCLPEARMTDDGNACRVEVFVSHQVIDGAMQAIRPGSDRSPALRRASGCSWRGIERMDPVGEIVAVGV